MNRITTYNNIGTFKKVGRVDKMALPHVQSYDTGTVLYTVFKKSSVR